MEYKVLSTSWTEPIDRDDLKNFVGYAGADQNEVIDRIIIASREYFERYTGLSVVSKSYKAYFEEEDSDDGWYELPIAPVLDTPAITVTMNGTSTTFTQRGLKTVRILPDTVIGTVGVGITSLPNYLEVTFQAGATNEAANQCILEIAATKFTHRDEGENISLAHLPFDTVKTLKSLSKNL